MKSKDIRKLAIQRYLGGEKPVSIYTSLGFTKQWFFKWLRRYQSNDQFWFKEKSRKPHHHHNQTPHHLERIVIEIRNKLSHTKYSQIGAIAIQWEMQKIGVPPLPVWTINRILKRNNLIRKREKYTPSGKLYPDIGLDSPGSVLQMDVIGPRYIKGDGRFYSHNVIDVVSHKISLYPHRHKNTTAAAEALVKAWKTIGVTDFVQLDNALYYRGSNRWPRSFGLVIRLCLSLNVQPVFIPLAEPWRQGIIEKFNDNYNTMFFRSQEFSDFETLRKESITFEQFHNDNHRYSCLKSKTPNQCVADAQFKPALLDSDFHIPERQIDLEEGYIHLIRFIRSNRILDVFGERFALREAPPYEYVIATICIDIHTIKIYIDNQVVEEIYYPIPVDW